MRPLAAAFALALLAGCPFAAGVPGSRTDVSPVTARANGGRHAGVQVVTGAHWASIDDGEPGFDVGGGYIYQRLPSEASASVRATGAAMDSGLDLHAGYLSFDQNLVARRHWRAWAGARGELWFYPGALAPGASVRMGIELFAGGSGSAPIDDRCAVGVATTRGTSAIGLFVDAGVKAVANNERVTTASAGISLRLPNILMVGLALPCR